MIKEGRQTLKRSSTIKNQIAKSEPRFTKKLFNFFADLDLFGEKVTFTYQGRDTYPTLPGITISVFILIVIGIFTVGKIIQLVSREDPSITELHFKRNLETEEEWRPYVNSFPDTDCAFDFAFGTDTQIDQSIGVFEANEVTIN